MKRWGLSVLPLVGAALLASCGALTADDAVVGGETHFLVKCEEECGPGLSCIAGVCTRGCEPGYSSCSELASTAACVSAPDGRDRAGFGGTCDVLCSNDADCSSLPAGHTCREGACRADIPADLGGTSSLQSALVHAVDFETCRSGLRWMGGERSSAEMLPGSDCVGCHRDEGARPLVMGGTVYTLPTPNSQDHPPLDDCFGIEGIELQFTDAAGREFSTITNRAGNFYIEGDESDVTMPYSVSMRWTRDGEPINTNMATLPRYGGCARCHTNDPNARADDEFQLSPESSDYVNPTLVIFPPTL
ncbi:MAG TPA: hypothetical protein VMG12_03560 [Polyangiaceae bacterium]|nr:hypothetical protein [Polyangiaceae bacterium]